MVLGYGRYQYRYGPAESGYTAAADSMSLEMDMTLPVCFSSLASKSGPIWTFLGSWIPIKTFADQKHCTGK